MRKAASSKPSLVFTGKSQVRDRSKLGPTVLLGSQLYTGRRCLSPQKWQEGNLGNYGKRSSDQILHATPTLGMASLSFSKPSSESEQVFSLKVTVGFSLGLWMAWKVSWVLSRLLTALRDVHTFGGREGSARRSVMRPWASPITAISTVMLVPD